MWPFVRQKSLHKGLAQNIRALQKNLNSLKEYLNILDSKGGGIATLWFINPTWRWKVECLGNGEYKLSVLSIIDDDRLTYQTSPELEWTDDDTT